MITAKQRALDSILKSVRRKKYPRQADAPDRYKVPTETNLHTGNLMRKQK